MCNVQQSIKLNYKCTNCGYISNFKQFCTDYYVTNKLLFPWLDYTYKQRSTGQLAAKSQWTICKTGLTSWFHSLHYSHVVLYYPCVNIVMDYKM